LLKKLKIKYSIKKGMDQNTNIYVNGITKIIKEYFPKKKILDKWIFNFNRDLVFDEYANTDGCFTESKRSIQISTSKRKEAELLQLFFFYSGYRCQYFARRKNNKSKENFIIYVNKKDRVIVTSKKSTKIVEYKGSVWCVNVNNETLIVRRNNKIAITQNTHRKAINRQPIRGIDGGREALYISLGAYKSTDGYSRKKGYPPLTPEEMGGVGLIFYPKQKRVDCFWSITEGINAFKKL